MKPNDTIPRGAYVDLVLTKRDGSVVYSKISNDDVEVVASQRWHHAVTYGSHAYVRSSTTQDVNLYLHRFLLRPGRGFEVDHVNRDTLDNRRENLRIVTRLENAQNIKHPRADPQGFRGVYWRPRDRAFMAKLTFRGRQHYLGLHRDFEDAKAAVIEFCRIHKPTSAEARMAPCASVR